MAYTQQDRTIALAGIFQAADLVKDIAWKGKSNQAAIESSLESLFQFDAPDVISIYGNVTGILHGLRVLQYQLDNQYDQRNADVTRYVVTLIHLQKKLNKQPGMLNCISEQLEQIKSQLEYFDLTHTNTLSKIAEVYKTTISTLQPKIIIEGEQVYLSNNDNADKIRALLLAGIRASLLWQQTGGGRLQLLFSRRKYLASADVLLGKV